MAKNSKTFNNFLGTETNVVINWNIILAEDTVIRTLSFSNIFCIVWRRTKLVLKFEVKIRRPIVNVVEKLE